MPGAREPTRAAASPQSSSPAAMRPLRLEIEGFTSFADPTVLNLLDEFETEVYRTTTESARHA